MAEPECPKCAKLERELAEVKHTLAEVTQTLLAKIAELEAKLKQNSSNSSKPPSSDPPWQKPPNQKTSTGRKPGGQKGHPGHHRVRVPAGQVHEVVHHVPSTCAHCQASLSEQPGPLDPQPAWHQVVELAEVLAEVTEHQAHARTCPHCGQLTHAEVPADIRAHTIGPKLAATLCYLSGRCHLSKRTIEEIAETVFKVPVSLGTLSALEGEMSQALRAPQAEALAAVRGAPVKNVDETGWFKRGKICWLWLAATMTIAAYQIHRKRGTPGFKALLGNISGIVCSDRWHAYARLPLHLRQVCWAHLKRDFQKLFELGAETKAIGRAGRRAVKETFSLWTEFKAGRIDRNELQTRLAPVRARLKCALQRGRDGPDKKTMRFCKRLLKCYDALWTFAAVEGVEPTNNHAERMLRPSVLWRKRCFGNQSDEGCRFAERIMTVVQTLRLRQHPVLAYLHAAIAAHRAGAPVPALLAA